MQKAEGELGLSSSLRPWLSALFRLCLLLLSLLALKGRALTPEAWRQIPALSFVSARGGASAFAFARRWPSAAFLSRPSLPPPGDSNTRRWLSSRQRAAQAGSGAVWEEKKDSAALPAPRPEGASGLGGAVTVWFVHSAKHRWTAECYRDAFKVLLWKGQLKSQVSYRVECLDGLWHRLQRECLSIANEFRALPDVVAFAEQSVPVSSGPCTKADSRALQALESLTRAVRVFLNDQHETSAKAIASGAVAVFVAKEVEHSTEESDKSVSVHFLRSLEDVFAAADSIIPSSLRYASSEAGLRAASAAQSKILDSRRRKGGCSSEQSVFLLDRAMASLPLQEGALQSFLLGLKSKELLALQDGARGLAAAVASCEVGRPCGEERKVFNPCIVLSKPSPASSSSLHRLQLNARSLSQASWKSPFGWRALSDSLRLRCRLWESRAALQIAALCAGGDVCEKLWNALNAALPGRPWTFSAESLQETPPSPFFEARQRAQMGAHQVERILPRLR